MHKLNIYSLLFVLAMFCSCSTQKDNIEYYSNGNLKSVELKDISGHVRKIYFNSNGQVTEMRNEISSDTIQCLYFDTTNSKLSKIIPLYNNKAYGEAFWFYPSGNMRATRYYVDDLETDIGMDYWDYYFPINKAMVRFRNGEVFYRQNFDTSGRPTFAEGDSVNAGVINLKAPNNK